MLGPARCPLAVRVSGPGIEQCLLPSPVPVPTEDDPAAPEYRCLVSVSRPVGGLQGEEGKEAVSPVPDPRHQTHRQATGSKKTLQCGSGAADLPRHTRSRRHRAASCHLREGDCIRSTSLPGPRLRKTLRPSQASDRSEPFGSRRLPQAARCCQFRAAAGHLECGKNAFPG